MIVKIQRPISTNEAVPKALIYNEDRSVELIMPYTGKLAEIIGNDLKQYWDVKLGIQPDGKYYIGDQLTLIEEVEDPGW